MALTDLIRGKGKKEKQEKEEEEEEERGAQEEEEADIKELFLVLQVGIAADKKHAMGRLWL